MSNGQGSGRASHFQACALDDRLMTLALITVLAALGTYSDELGYCFPKQETLAKRLGMQRENVNRYVQRLVRLGYLEVIHQYREDGGQAGNAYRLLLDFQLPIERYRVPPPRVIPTNTPPVSSSNTPPVSSSVTPLTSHSERPIENERPTSAPPAPVAPSAATPRESGFAFLVSEPLYAAACAFLVKPKTRAEFGRWARAIVELRDVDATPAQLRLAARRFREMFPRAHLTITALSSNWTLLLQGDTPYGSHRQDTEHDEATRAAQREHEARERERLTEWAIAQLATNVDQAAPADASRLPRQV